MPPVWEWESDKGWRWFNPAEAKLVEDAHRTGKRSAVLTLGKHEYTLNFAAMTQQNVTTGKVRNLRRSGAKSKSPVKKSPPPSPKKPAKKVKHPGVQWEWQRGKHWEGFSQRDNSAIERAHARDELKCKITLKGHAVKQGLVIEVHFGHMTQTNTETGTRHTIRRRELGAAELAEAQAALEEAEEEAAKARAAEAHVKALAAKASAAAPAHHPPPSPKKRASGGIRGGGGIRKAAAAAAAAAADYDDDADTEPPDSGDEAAPAAKRPRVD